MLTRMQILELIPHQGSMCLLDGVTAWTDSSITCHTSSHLSPHNPLRHADRLSAICGPEYGLQAAALHCALTGGGRQPGGYLAALRDVVFRAERLDDVSLGPLRVEATRELRAQQGLIYRFVLTSVHGEPVLHGRASIILPT